MHSSISREYPIILSNMNIEQVWSCHLVCMWDNISVDQGGHSDGQLLTKPDIGRNNVDRLSKV